MPNIDQYSIDDKLRAILQGPPGSGKSVLASKFPKPWFIDLDVNLGGPLYFMKERGMPLPVGYDRVDLDEKGELVPPKQRYLRLTKALLDAQANPAVETIVIDSATNLAGILEQEVLRQQNKNTVQDYKDGRQFWGFYFQAGKHLMSTLTSMRKHIILTMHEKTDTDVDGHVIFPIKPAWPGQLGEIIGAFFTDVWRCETVVTPKGLDKEYKWMVSTMPDGKYLLKNSRCLPPKFEFQWDVIQKTLDKYKAPTI